MALKRLKKQNDNIYSPDFLLPVFQGKVQELRYPTWAIIIFISLILLAVMPVPVVFLLRYFNVVKESSSSLSSVSYKKGRIIKQSPQPGEDDDTSLIHGKMPSAPEMDAMPNGSYGLGYLMVDVPDVPESDL